jgi:hypothetical protein
MEKYQSYVSLHYPLLKADVPAARTPDSQSGQGGGSVKVKCGHQGRDVKSDAGRQRGAEGCVAWKA